MLAVEPVGCSWSSGCTEALQVSSCGVYTPSKGPRGAGAPLKMATGSRWLLLENMHLGKDSRRAE